MKSSRLFIFLFALLSLDTQAQITPLSQWIWMNGTIRDANYTGVYGTQGTPAINNNPGSLERCVSWKDASGNFWLFGGNGCANTLTVGYLNALWKYNPLINQWTWIKGDNTINVLGVYGTKGVAAIGNKPGARYLSVSWMDSNGKLWLFGGLGYAATGSPGRLNDLWKYDPVTNMWTWMKGDNTINQAGTYGTQGTPADLNNPGARYGCGSWIDGSNNLWLFGGDANFLANDLWKYNPTTNQWTWMKGDNTGSVLGVYGLPGVQANTNKPGSRVYTSSWKDKTGNFWLFGAGSGFGGIGSFGALSDLWKYNPAVNQWTWMKGDSLSDLHGIYGIAGTSTATNNPGARGETAAWTDTTGNLWMFGGDGFAGSSSPLFNLLSDLWKYNPLTNQWVWIKGDSTISLTAGVYGVYRLASTYNRIAARRGCGAWIDSTNTIWLFGGNANADTNPDYYNDLWKLPPLQIFLSTVTTDWENPDNWDRKIIPDSNSVVVINSGTMNLNSNRPGGTVIVNAGATLNINTNDTLKMFGYLTNKGQINGTGSVFITGDTSWLNSPGPINVPITLSGKRLHLKGHSNTSALIFTDGSTIRLDSFHLNMGAATLTRNANSFIITNDTGRLIRNVATAPVDFPVGADYNSYTPVTITNNGTAGNLKVRVATGVSNVQPSDNGNVDRTWFIDSTVGGSNLTVQTQWNTGNEQSGFDRNNSFISQSHGCQPPPNCIDTYYDAVGRTAATGTDPYIQLRSNITGPTSFIVKSSADTSTFTGNAGNGLWDDPNNWTIGIVPSHTIANGKIIVIHYTNGVPCTVIGNIIIEPGGQLIIRNNSLLTVTGSIINH